MCYQAINLFQREDPWIRCTKKLNIEYWVVACETLNQQCVIRQSICNRHLLTRPTSFHKYYNILKKYWKKQTKKIVDPHTLIHFISKKRNRLLSGTVQIRGRFGLHLILLLFLICLWTLLKGGVSASCFSNNWLFPPHLTSTLAPSSPSLILLGPCWTPTVLRKLTCTCWYGVLHRGWQSIQIKNSIFTF